MGMEEESEQRLENVNRTHLELASEALQLQIVLPILGQTLITSPR